MLVLFSVIKVKMAVLGLSQTMPLQFPAQHRQKRPLKLPEFAALLRGKNC
jgi:hypothetical protein